MSIAMAYITVILVWTTTPLGVTWSSETIHPTLAALVRMAMAAVLGWCLLRAMGKSLSWSKPAIKKYLHADIGIALAMYATYQAAGLIPSGLISVVYGLAPIMSALFAQLILKDAMPLYRWIASIISLAGLIMIFKVDVSLAEDTAKGLGLLFLAVTLFSLSGVLIKQSDHRNGHLEQTVGALIMSVPIYLVILLIELAVMVFDSSASDVINQTVSGIDSVSNRSVLAILYLAIMGSLVGFISYFYILSALKPSTVALVTLITPVLALMLGIIFNNEVVESHVWVGTAVILLGLVLFNWGERLVSLVFLSMSPLKISNVLQKRGEVKDGVVKQPEIVSSE
ncbi:DMT family transporter [Litoribrevibacter euphylliae]|uniref:DMT family transporter n=1 Tax=Litoribrevibacter euphylliae TaxID=1834034 RepID=A0ABV7HCR9_9GAMM